MQEHQIKIDQYFLTERERQERLVYDRLLSHGGDVRLNRRNLEADSRAIFGIDFETLERALRSLKSERIAGILPPNVLLKKSVSQRPPGWRTHADTEVFLRIWISNSFKKLQRSKLENLLVV